MAQIWPSLDNFALNDTNAGVTWDYPGRYFASTPTYNVVAQSGVLFLGVPGILYAYKHTNGTQPLGAPFGASLAAYAGNFENSGSIVNVCAMCERTQFAKDVEVSADFSLFVGSAENPAADTQALRGYAIWARMSGGMNVFSGGILVDPGNLDFGVFRQAGIFFFHAKPALAPDRLMVGYTNDNVIGAVYLGDITVESLFAGTSSAQPYGFYAPQSLRMVCSGVSVTCFATFGGVELQVFSVNVPQSLNAAGRCAISPQFPATDFVSNLACTAFQIKDLATSTVLFRDEFIRPLLNSNYLVPNIGTHESLINGYSLMSAYTGDAYGNTDVSLGDQYLFSYQLHGDKTTAGIDLGADLFGIIAGKDQQYGWYLSQDRAPDVSSQRSAVTVDDFAGVAKYEVGVAVRMTYLTQDGTNSSPREYRAADTNGPIAVENHARKIGYLLTATFDLTWTLRLYRYEASDDTRTLMGIATPPRPVGPFKLELEVRDTLVGGGPPEFMARLNDVDTALAPIGETVANGNWLTDSSAGSISSGVSTGFFYRGLDPVEAAGILRVKAFETLTPTAPIPPPPPPPGQASIVMPSEDANKAGTLTLPLTWSIDESLCYENDSADYSTGFRYSFPKYSRLRRLWKVSFKAASYAEMDSYLELVSANVPFDWVRADTGETFTAQLKGKAFRVKNEHTAGGEGVVSGKFTLVEVFSSAAFNA